MSVSVATPQLELPAAAPATRVRLHYGDAIRILGTLAVIVGHVCDMQLFQYAGAAERGRLLDWWVCCVLDVASRWAVPVFVMLSGALLLGQFDQPPRLFYRRRFARVGMATMFWSPVFMLFAVYWLPESWGKSWPRVMNNLMLGQPYDHMHFLFRIVGLYLFTPALRVFVKHADRRMLIGTVALCFAVAGANSVVGVLAGSQANAFSRFVPFVGYFLAGYALRDIRPSRRLVALAWFGFVATTALVAWTTGLLLEQFGQSTPTISGDGLALDPTYSAYPVAHLGLEFLNPVRIVMGLCVWVIFVGTFTRPTRPGAAWQWLSRVGAPATLGIYLVHPLFREMLYIKGITPTWHRAWIGIPVMSIAVLIPSALLTLALTYDPLLRRLVGADDMPVKTSRGRRIAALSAVMAIAATALAVWQTRPPREAPPEPTPPPSSVEAALGGPRAVEGFVKASRFAAPQPGPTIKPAPPATNPSLDEFTGTPDRNGHYRMVYRATIDGRQFERPYLLYLPAGYDARTSTPLPMLVFLHGGWEGGANHELLMLHGPPKLVEFFPEFRRRTPFIILSPQAEYDRGFHEPDMAQCALGIIDEVCRRFPVDRARIYGTGLSIGGSGIWHLAIERPTLFAAIAPLCAKDIEQQKAAAALRKLPIFTAVGLNDDQHFIELSRHVAKTIRDAGGNIILKEIPDAPHDVWTDIYAGTELYEWFLKHRRTDIPKLVDRDVHLPRAYHSAEETRRGDRHTGRRRWRDVLRVVPAR